VKSEGIWSLYHKNVDKDGNIDNIYRCNRVNFRGEQCQSGVYLSYPCHNTEIILYRSSLPHTCDKIPTKSKKKISEIVRNEIKVLFELKPKKILELLQEKELELPNMTDLKNYLSLLRKQEFLPHTVSLGELERFLIDHCTVPEDDNVIRIRAIVRPCTIRTCAQHPRTTQPANAQDTTRWQTRRARHHRLVLTLNQLSIIK
jgi:hypothetical protein